MGSVKDLCKVGLTLVAAILIYAASAAAGVLDKGDCPEEKPASATQKSAGGKKGDCPVNVQSAICSATARAKLSLPLQLKLKGARAIDRHAVSIKLADGTDGTQLMQELKLKKARPVGKTTLTGELKKNEICRAAESGKVKAIELVPPKALK